MNDHDNIHAIVFQPLEPGRGKESKRGALITLHPNQASALAYFKTEKTILARNYYLPVVDHAEKQVLGISIINQESLRDTYYSVTPDKLYREVSEAIQTGEKCHVTHAKNNDPFKDKQAAVIDKIVRQSKFIYIPLDEVPTPLPPSHGHKEPGTKRQPR